MGFEDDVRGLRTARDETAAREKDDFTWLEGQIEEFNTLVLEAVRILEARGAVSMPVVEKRRGRLGGTKYVPTGETAWWDSGPYAITKAGLRSCHWCRKGDGPYCGKFPDHPAASGYLILGDRADNRGEGPAMSWIGRFRVGLDFQSKPPNRLLELEYVGPEAGYGDARAWLTKTVAQLLP